MVHPERFNKQEEKDSLEFRLWLIQGISSWREKATRIRKEIIEVRDRA